jgi:hypothetical protein
MENKDFFTLESKPSNIETDIAKHIVRLFKGTVLSKKEVQYLPKQVQNLK